MGGERVAPAPKGFELVALRRSNVKQSPLNVPLATYRLQLGSHLRFADARQLVSYLWKLGIGTAYISPFFCARRGSTHGYDVVDHRQLDPQLGSEQEFQAMAEELCRHDMGLLVDIVPNHMCVDDPRNAWWQDILENGPGSPFAKYFDIDWSPPKEGLRGKVLLAVLGDQFGKVLENQQLKIEFEDQRFVVHYYDSFFPTDPKTWVPILKRALEFVVDLFEPESAERMELESIITALEHLPDRTQADADAIQQRYREKEVASRRLSSLLETSSEIRQGLARAMEDYNGRRGEPSSFDNLESFLADQPYRLCHWRVATDEINYRRFFDVNMLAAIRVEDPEVFVSIHELVLRFIEHGWVTGLRVDHLDGLLDPQQYLTSLTKAIRGVRGNPALADRVLTEEPFYIVAEKILAYDESLPAEWPIQGTTGYDFLNLLNGLFVDRSGVHALRDAYLRLTGSSETFPQVLYESKRAILATSLSSELNVLSHELDQISEQHRWSRDFTRLSLYRALREVVACFPVYRTYTRPETDVVRDEDRRRILAAVRLAKRRNPAMSHSFFDFIASVLLLEDPAGLSETSRQARRRFVLKFQQVTGPVTAKGLEDTAFYRFYPLASLNEVGADPMIPGTSVEQFHHRIRDRMIAWPHELSATGTHDTKRGEDVRARLNVLSEIPGQWEAAVRRWQAINAAARCELDGAPVPDANEEYLIYQTLVGTWPVEPLEEAARQSYTERIVLYLDKALREAKLHTSWLNPYEEYDRAVANFIRTVLVDSKSAFIADLTAFVRSIADAGFVNSLAQTLIKICVPGVPDFYQGVECWDFNLVDPDNRRPVDFTPRRRMLDELESLARDDLPRLAADLLDKWPDERLKLFLMWRALQFRREHIQLFRGDYLPLAADGARKAQLCAFARTQGTQWAICIVPRIACAAWSDFFGGSQSNGHKEKLLWPVADWWQGTIVSLGPEAPTRWRHVITGQRIEAALQDKALRVFNVSEVLRCFPVALLTPDES
jgi:(1->4)-alpha-D-glucan 1-alpha-D-glucosylmutase